MKRTVTKEKGQKQYMKAKEDRRLMSDVRRWEEERRCVKTKRQCKSDSKSLLYVLSKP